MRALAWLLRPLVLLCIRSGVTFPILADLLRGLYVDVASRDLLSGERARTDSRLSLLTGIHRKELRRQRLQPAPALEPAVVTLTSQAVARWLGDPDYLDGSGAPRPLPRTGPAASFDSLIAGVTRDMRSRAVLDEWLSRGLARLDGEGRVVLQAQGLLPQENMEARLFYFARNLQDHLAAAGANIVTQGHAPFLERSLRYERLGLTAAQALERAAREAANSMLLDLNRIAVTIADRDDLAAREAPDRATRRVNLGVYLYVEDEQPPPSEQGASDPDEE